MLRFFAATARAVLLGLTFAAAGPATLHASAADGSADYKIVSVDGDAGTRKLSVRIERRLSEPALKDLALLLAAKAKNGERIATVNVYLAKADLTRDPWGSVRIQGASAQVSVLGLRLEEENAFRAEAEADTRDVVGVWLTSPPALAGKLTILRAQKGRFIAEWHLRSGQKTTDEVTMTRLSRGYRYDVVGGEGAYYLATWGGELQLGDATRTIALAEKLDVAKRPASSAKIAAGGRDHDKAVVSESRSATAVRSAAEAATAATAAVAAAPTVSVRAVQRSRRAAPATARKKSGSSVADLMGGSISR